MSLAFKCDNCGTLTEHASSVKEIAPEGIKAQVSLIRASGVGAAELCDPCWDPIVAAVASALPSH